jgi:3-deoxy-7-phosphoheptulonate synthase
VVKISEPYKLAGRTFKPEDTVIKMGDVSVGGRDIVIMAGPCAVESDRQLDIIAGSVRRYGARILRGGAFKPRTSPYTFQGLGEEGLRLLRKVADRNDLKVVTEVMDTGQVALVAEWADILQVGARNMQNFNLLKELGKARKPVMLKRGLSATIQEWLLSAEYIMAGGNHEVMLCERGIRTFENMTRNTMDISAIPILKKLSHLPVIADPSHGTGLRDKVIPMARAAVAAGADGIMVEVHHEPEAALSDGPQSIYPEQFAELMAQLRIIAPAIGRTV